jgi:hypothetical protein
MFNFLKTVLNASSVVRSSDESFGSILCLEGLENAGGGTQRSNYNISVSLGR